MKAQKLESISQKDELKEGDFIKIVDLGDFFGGCMDALVESKKGNSIMLFAQHSMGGYCRFEIKDIKKAGIWYERLAFTTSTHITGDGNSEYLEVKERDPMIPKYKEVKLG